MKEYSAGGVVYRENGGRIEVLLIHDRFGKMTLPKGHLEDRETEKQAALREVAEETGIQAQIVGDPLGVVSFAFDVPGKGTVTKEVTYYLMKAVSGDLRPQQDEIRGVFWFPVEEALQIHAQRGYENNAIILERAAKRLRGDAS